MFLLYNVVSFFGLLFLCHGSHLSLILEDYFSIIRVLLLVCECVPRHE
jgi:hypothetical protein